MNVTVDDTCPSLDFPNVLINGYGHPSTSIPSSIRMDHDYLAHLQAHRQRTAQPARTQIAFRYRCHSAVPIGSN
jgi:hypothetical protein